MEKICALVTSVLKEYEDRGRVLVAAQVETRSGLVSAKIWGYGRAPDEPGQGCGIKPGDCVAADGDWSKTQFNGRQEDQFKAGKLRPDLPRTAEGIAVFLMSAFRNLGIQPQRIRDAVAARGAETIKDALKDPETLVRLSSDPARWRPEILAEWAKLTQGGQAVSLMEASGLAVPIIDRIMTGLPPDGPLERIKSNPWKVGRINDVGFDNADRIGMHMGLARDDQRRLTEAVVAVLKDQEAKGSTAAPLDVLLAQLQRRSGISRDVLVDFLQDAARRQDHDIAILDTPSGPVSALLRLYVAEADIQMQVKRLVSRGRTNSPERVRAVLQAVFKNPRFAKFDAVQRLAVEMACTESVSIVTGGPGTGKSTVMEAVAMACELLDPGKVILVGPTGMSAKRLNATTGREASTVHVSLQARGDETGPVVFARNSANRLPAGCTVIVDEVSMLDADLAAALLSALPDDGRVILVGDRHQLPSVGAGAVLADLLEAESGGEAVVPSVELVEVYRTTKDSGIATGAALVKDGTLPELGPEDKNGVSFRDTAESDISDEIERLVCVELAGRGYDPVSDVAIICPMAEGPGGTWEVNRRLSARLNRDGKPLPGVSAGMWDKREMPIPRSGDRVMLTKNDRDRGVANGDIGTITGSGTVNGKPTFRVRYDCGVELEYPAHLWRRLILAYAITCHKSQGSQFKVVVMPFASAHRKMLRRALVYTGWTRAQEKLVMLGNRAALQEGVANVGEKPTTLLRRFLARIERSSLRRTGAVSWRSLYLAALPAGTAATSRPAATAMPPPLPAAARPPAAWLKTAVNRATAALPRAPGPTPLEGRAPPPAPGKLMSLPSAPKLPAAPPPTATPPPLPRAPATPDLRTMFGMRKPPLLPQRATAPVSILPSMPPSAPAPLPPAPVPPRGGTPALPAARPTALQAAREPERVIPAATRPPPLPSRLPVLPGPPRPR